MKEFAAAVFMITVLLVVQYFVANTDRYKSYEELSTEEILFIRECVKHLPYFMCSSNIHQMRQIGIVP